MLAVAIVVTLELAVLTAPSGYAWKQDDACYVFFYQTKNPNHKPCKELFTAYKPDNLRLMLCVREVLPVKCTSLKKQGMFNILMIQKRL